LKISGNHKIIHTDKVLNKTASKKEDREPNDLVQIGSSPCTENDLKVYEIGEAVSGGTITGNIRIHRNFHSNILGNDRDVLVYLPPGYSKEKSKKYPVLYLQDGQNMFNRETSFSGEWGIDEAAERLIREGKIKDIIMVAIYNKDRMNEYTPVPDPEHGGGKLDDYAAFVTEEMKPFIDKTYKTSLKPEDTGILGSSLGGLSALYMGWKLPFVFGLCGVISPSLWWSDKYLTKEIASDPQTKGPGKIWLDMGTAEGSGADLNNNGIPDVLDNTREMGEILLDKGYVFGKELFYHEEPGAGHNEWSWSQRIGRVLEYLYGK